MKHVIITRFNLNLYSVGRDVATREGKRVCGEKDEWMERRLTLFFKYCAPSVIAQTCKNFVWVILMDTETPDRFREPVEEWAGQYNFIELVYVGRDEQSSGWTTPIILKFAGKHDKLVTTRFDNDDAIDPEYVSHVQKEARKTKKALLVFPTGACWDDRHDVATIQWYVFNNTISFVAPNGDPDTVHREQHEKMCRFKTIMMRTSRPMWMHVIHQDNLSNRMRGKTCSLEVIRRMLPSVPAGTPAKQKLQMFVCVSGQHFVGTVNLIREHAQEIASGQIEIEWNAITSGPIKNLVGFNVRERCEQVRGPSGKLLTSESHAKALNQIHQYIDGDCPFVIADQDFAFLKRGWDKIVIEEVRNVDVFGASWDEAKNITPYMGRRLPCVFFMAFRAGFPLQGLDFMPCRQDDGTLSVPNRVCDTGFQFMEFSDEMKLKTAVLDNDDRTFDHCSTSADYSYGGEKFAIHMGFSRYKGKKFDQAKFRLKKLIRPKCVSN